MGQVIGSLKLFKGIFMHYKKEENKIKIGGKLYEL